jgi:hypothetical protein
METHVRLDGRSALSDDLLPSEEDLFPLLFIVHFPYVLLTTKVAGFIRIFSELSDLNFGQFQVDYSLFVRSE